MFSRMIRAGDKIRSSLQLVGVEQRRQGVLTSYRFDHHDAVGGEHLCTTWQSSYWRGAKVLSAKPGEPTSITAEDRLAPPFPARGMGACTGPRVGLEVSAHEGVVYSECTRIWNPIHTDAASARAAGLTAPILHGTATLAKCVTAIVEAYGDGDPGRILRVAAGRFGAYVPMPSASAAHLARDSRRSNDGFSRRHGTL